MKKMRQVLALLLTVAMMATLTACGGDDKGKSDNTGDASKDSGEKQEEVEAAGTYDTLVIGVDPLEGVFSPFFYQSAFDDQVNELIFSSPVALDPNGEVMDKAGHVELEEVKGDDGSTKYKYTVTLKKDMTFSDGEPVTIDDLIFTYYVLCDPTYDGMSTLGTLDIAGLKEYYYDTPDYTSIVEGLEKYQTENISEEDFTAYIIATKANGWFDDTLPGDPAGDGSMTWAQYVAGAGVATQEEADAITDPAEMLKLVAKAEFATSKDSYDAYSYYKSQAVSGTLEDGVDVEKISGIEKVDDLTCTVTFNSPNISGDKQIAWLSIMPEHYYGKDFKKGDLASVKALNTAPLGSGPYVFESYESNIVTLKANPNYFLGAPKIPNIKLQVVNEEDKVDLVLNGDIDITSPSASLEIVEQLDGAKDTASYTLVDNPGYGYIGINAERIPDLNVRKGLMHLMNRAPAISSYYGELGEVIERTMTPTLAEYPKDAKEFYGYNPDKALEFFKAAGYEQVDGKLVKDGEQLKVEVGIGDANTHPSTPMLTQMANDMEKMGAQLVVNDMIFSNLSPAVDGGQLDMWVMAWGNSTDCDLTQIFGSKGGSNYQRYSDPKIDAIQEEILKTLDFDKRCELVSQELDMIMDAAIYMPIYQRKNMEIYNATTVNLETLPEETTTYYNYPDQIEKLEMN